MAPDKKWMDLINDRLGEAYRQGIENFLDYAFERTRVTNEIRCPCVKCANAHFGSRESVKMHLIVYGILQNYRFWYHHGEKPEDELELHNSELENTAADVSGLFSKIERKDKIEEGNKKLVQNFQSLLTQHLDSLHKAVSASVVEQENKLKEMEEDMESFVSIKSKATNELRLHVERLKNMYGSRIKSLDELAGEIDKNSGDTLGRLNSQVSMHSSALEDCFKGIALEADHLLNELQLSLSQQEDKLATFAQQQREGHLRAVESTRSISMITSGFFQTLDNHASKLTKIMEESQTMQNQQLLDLENKFEECAAREEEQLLEKVAEMLASSSATKKKLT